MAVPVGTVQFMGWPWAGPAVGEAEAAVAGVSVLLGSIPTCGCRASPLVLESAGIFPQRKKRLVQNYHALTRQRPGEVVNASAKNCSRAQTSPSRSVPIPPKKEPVSGPQNEAVCCRS